ncbi:AI-2E family transporter [Brachybacterium sp. GPGPB12]|uniref:AI-2E family transporter n=1 Tax=Brachybacterium sp. GPGPB12 TaxID=3023517 RepID=UPI0031345943
MQQYSGQLVSGAVTTAAALGNIGTGIVVALFTLFFVLHGGGGIWRWSVGLAPPAARVPTHEAFRRGWKALSAYVRTQVLVAAVDATGIAIGMVALSLGSYAVPIWSLVFLFSFIPLVGAIASGAIAVPLVLVLNGWVGALIMLAVVLAVQRLEGNVLQPFLMGKAVEIHPLGVFLGVALGAMIAGIPGALFAIPLIAFVNATLLYVVGRDPSPELGHDKASAEHFAALGSGVPAHQLAEVGADSEARGRRPTREPRRTWRCSAPSPPPSAGPRRRTARRRRGPARTPPTGRTRRTPVRPALTPLTRPGRLLPGHPRPTRWTGRRPSRPLRVTARRTSGTDPARSVREPLPALPEGALSSVRAVPPRPVGRAAQAEYGLARRISIGKDFPVGAV